MSLPSTSRCSRPSQQTCTAEQALQTIRDGDDNQDILSDGSLEHDGEGSDDEETADDVRQLLGQTAPARRESEVSHSSAEQARVDFEHSERLWQC